MTDKCTEWPRSSQEKARSCMQPQNGGAKACERKIVHRQRTGRTWTYGGGHKYVLTFRRRLSGEVHALQSERHKTQNQQTDMPSKTVWWCSFRTYVFTHARFTVRGWKRGLRPLRAFDSQLGQRGQSRGLLLEKCPKNSEPVLGVSYSLLVLGAICWHKAIYLSSVCVCGSCVCVLLLEG